MNSVMIEPEIMSVQNGFNRGPDVSGDVAERGMGAEIMVAPAHKIIDL